MPSTVHTRDDTLRNAISGNIYVITVDKKASRLLASLNSLSFLFWCIKLTPKKKRIARANFEPSFTAKAPFCNLAVDA